MIRKYHNHTLQTNPWQREEESQTIYSNNKSKATSSLFLFNMIAKLERTQSNAQQNKDKTQNPHKQWEAHQTTEQQQQQQNHRLRTDSSMKS